MADPSRASSSSQNNVRSLRRISPGNTPSSFIDKQEKPVKHSVGIQDQGASPTDTPDSSSSSSFGGVKQSPPWQWINASTVAKTQQMLQDLPPVDFDDAPFQSHPSSPDSSLSSSSLSSSSSSSSSSLCSTAACIAPVTVISILITSISLLTLFFRKSRGYWPWSTHSSSLLTPSNSTRSNYGRYTREMEGVDPHCTESALMKWSGRITKPNGLRRRSTWVQVDGWVEKGGDEEEEREEEEREESGEEG